MFHDHTEVEIWKDGGGPDGHYYRVLLKVGMGSSKHLAVVTFEKKEDMEAFRAIVQKAYTVIPADQWYQKPNHLFTEGEGGIWLRS